jgi:hypothetical protein
MVDTAVGRARDVRGWGLVGALGVLGFLAGSVVGTVVPGAGATTGWKVVSAISAVLLIGSVVGVARAGAAGPGWLGRTGLVVSAAGFAVVALGFTIDAVVGLEPVASTSAAPRCCSSDRCSPGRRSCGPGCGPGRRGGRC